MRSRTTVSRAATEPGPVAGCWGVEGVDWSGTGRVYFGGSAQPHGRLRAAQGGIRGFPGSGDPPPYGRMDP
ncbi:hypothetical protein GCM10023198_41430 [Promicromonospora umidemergens]|uniref:Uncharacterized protein n=1 Tax=Promicromonospora umidemergens TaxID=629679 RepID=A0ABP8XRV4_9MICO